jgi:hypothetical protein
LERKAYAAIAKEDEARHKVDRAKSEATLQKRLDQYEHAYHACEQAMALYDQLAILLHLLHEALRICSPHGRLRTRQGVRSELTLLFQMIEELDCVAISPTLKPLKTHLDDILVPFEQAEAIHAQLLDVMPQNVLDALVLAWHHDHCSYPSQAKQKRAHQRERDAWLAFAEGLLGDAFETLKPLVFDQLDSIIRASSLVEMVNSLIRPYLNSCKGHITQEALNLIMFYQNHRRYKSGKRQGKAPLELLTEKLLEAEWWELLIQQVNREHDAKALGVLPSRPPLQLMVHHGGGTNRQVSSACQATLEHTDVSEKEPRQPVAEAA